MAAARERLINNPAAIWLAATLGGAAIHGLLWQVSEPPNLFNDFHKANWLAAETLWQHGLAATWPLTEKGGFSNLPVIGWLYVPLVPLGEQTAAWTWWAMGVAALLGAWALLVRLARLEAPSAALLLFVFLVSGPVVNSLREGQSSHFILLFMVVGLWLWHGKRTYLAGIAFGACALIKLPLLLFGVYFVLRQRWSIVAGGATTIGVAALLSLLLFGIDGNIGWYREWVVPYLNGYIPAFNVQSIDSFLTRLLMGEEFVRHWDPPIQPTRFHMIARYSAFAALFGGSAWLIWHAHRRVPAADAPSPRDLLEFVLVLDLALITSPISWTHYYVWLLVPLALYRGCVLPLPDDATTRRLMRVGFVLVSVPVIMWSPIEPSWYAAILTRTVVSVWLFGAIVIFAALARGFWHVQPGMAGTQPARGAP